VKYRISICILLCLAILASGQAAAQGTYGTKVQAGDPDVGLPLSTFAPLVPPIPLPQSQFNAYVSYWDLNSNNVYDAQDVAYLQFGSSNAPFQSFVQANNIRLTGWGIYPAGSYVKAIDSDMSKPLILQPPALPSSASTTVSFYYLDATAGAGYDLGDPVYLKVQSPGPAINGVGTNDIRITANAGFPAGSIVSLNDPDAARPLTLFKLIPIPFLIQAQGGPFVASARLPVAQLAFFNANGNTDVIGTPIYDDGDVVYFDIAPGAVATPIVSPNDIRLF